MLRRVTQWQPRRRPFLARDVALWIFMYVYKLPGYRMVKKETKYSVIRVTLARGAISIYLLYTYIHTHCCIGRSRSRLWPWLRLRASCLLSAVCCLLSALKRRGPHKIGSLGLTGSSTPPHTGIPIFCPVVLTNHNKILRRAAPPCLLYSQPARESLAGCWFLLCYPHLPKKNGPLQKNS